jgi:hypothetical protein
VDDKLASLDALLSKVYDAADDIEVAYKPVFTRPTTQRQVTEIDRRDYSYFILLISEHFDKLQEIAQEFKLQASVKTNTRYSKGKDI